MSLENNASENSENQIAFQRGHGDVSRWLKERDLGSLREHLYRYRPILREMAARYGGAIPRSSDDGSDIVQDTLYDAVRALDSVRAISSPQFFAWLKTLLKNRIRMSIRRNRHSVIGGEKRYINAEDCNPYSIEDADSSPFPEEKIAELENLERLSRVVSKLPQELRLLLKWRFEEGLTFKEIGKKINRTPDSVRMLFNRCLARIREECFG